MPRKWSEGNFSPDLQSRRNAAIALADNSSLQDAAKAAHVSETSIRKWMEETEFRNLYLEACRAKWRLGLGKLSASTDRAVTTLLKNMECGNPQVEVRAAATLFDILNSPNVRDTELEEARQFAAQLQTAVAGLPPEMKRLVLNRLQEEAKRTEEGPVSIFGIESDDEEDEASPDEPT